MSDSVESWLVSAGRDRRPGSPLNVPPMPESNFVLGERRAYSRDDGTPGWEALEEIVGGLEGGSSVAFASGMAGIAAIFDQLPAGSVVALPDDCYQGVAGLAQAGERRGRWTVHRVAVTDTVRWVELCGVADLIWLESPSNPLLTVGDLDTICAAPRKPGAILGVDNTFATPLNQRPLTLGADVAVQSVTKFIGGHSDLLGGVVTVRDANLLAALRQSRELTGATPGTLEAFLAVRGARTLALRLERAQHNAMILAERLARHPNVTLTRYPGLASHPTSRGGATPTQGLRHDHLVRRAWRRVCRRRGLRRIAAGSTRHEPWRSRVHHGAAGQHSRAGAPASSAAAPECGDRGRRGSLDRSGSGAALRMRVGRLSAPPVVGVGVVHPAGRGTRYRQLNQQAACRSFELWHQSCIAQRL